jgi:hypothetical protein
MLRKEKRISDNGESIIAAGLRVEIVGVNLVLGLGVVIAN